jgi:hypothetical protein
VILQAAAAFGEPEGRPRAGCAIRNSLLVPRIAAAAGRRSLGLWRCDASTRLRPEDGEVKQMDTDTKLQDQVLSELRWAHLDDPSNVRVEVRDGQVILSGEVPSEEARSAAEWAAGRVHGVKGVECEILVIEQPSRIIQ